MDQIMSISELI